MIKNYLNMWDFFSWSNPKFFLGRFEASSFDFLDLCDSIVPLVTPLKLFVQKVEHREVKGPNVITPGQVNIIMSIKTSKRYCPSEVCFSATRQRLLTHYVQVTLG
jgi:hypothetical protein